MSHHITAPVPPVQDGNHPQGSRGAASDRVNIVIGILRAGALVVE